MREPVLPELPENRALLDHLRAQAARARPGEEFALGDWCLHTHPDLYERFAGLLPGRPLTSVYGVPVAAHAGVAAAVALGTSVLLVRLPGPPADVAPGEPVPPLTDGEWYSLAPFPGRSGAADGDDALRAVLRAALWHARELSLTRPRRQPGPPDRPS
ncbi:hypothetical protein [Kitasatospora sp. NPDC097643]|uniref:hypothetical protein n=1 Tax=Kitasatospora sp. NPDC097643 TaxID=3157230 RepID=UPI00332369D6